MEPTKISRALAAPLAVVRGSRPQPLATRVRALTEAKLAGFPWEVRFEDWTGARWRCGGDAPHWRGLPLVVGLRSEAAGNALLRYDAMGFLEHVLAGDADLDGNLYLLPQIRRHAAFNLRLADAARFFLGSLRFQSPARARINVRSHYDVRQEALDLYLDTKYRAYSCGWFEEPERLDLGEALRVGAGEIDDFDSLEKAQWRKFRDAVDFLAPQEGDLLLDVGCGYGGQLHAALERHRFRRYVGWTHSRNQVEGARKLLASFDTARWEVREGDYRQEEVIYDHVTSTGMVSHVGPRGLVPYVRNVRRRIKGGGRYVHHALMQVWSPVPLDLQLGPVFHKRFVWPGFHWFTLGQHVRALERNGFEVQKLVNLSSHYAKTCMAWYERLMASGDDARQLLGDPTFRAWRLFLAGSASDLGDRGFHVYRIYCQAV